MSDIVKMSDVGSRMVRAARQWRLQAKLGSGRARSLVVFTRGAKGAIVYTNQHTVEVECRACHCRDTVGAGEPFNAGILAFAEREQCADQIGHQTLSPENPIGNALRLVPRPLPSPCRVGCRNSALGPTRSAFLIRPWSASGPRILRMVSAASASSCHGRRRRLSPLTHRQASAGPPVPCSSTPMIKGIDAEDLALRQTHGCSP